MRKINKFYFAGWLVEKSTQGIFYFLIHKPTQPQKPFAKTAMNLFLNTHNHSSTPTTMKTIQPRTIAPRTRKTARILAGSIAALLAVQLAAPAVRAAAVTWDITPGTVGAGDSAITGGTGTWDPSNVANGNWTTDAGANNVAWSNAGINTAVFGGASGTVTLASGATVGGLTFNDNAGYVVTGSTITFGTAGAITANVNAQIDSLLNANSLALAFAGAGNMTVSNAITNGAALTKSGAGTLTLAGTNGFTAATINGGTIAGGTLTLNSGATALTSSATSAVNSNVTITTAAGTITSNAGTLTLGGTLNAGGLALTFAGAGNTTVTNAIASGTTLTKSGGGTLTLSGANTYTGVTTVSGGVLQIGNAGITGTLGTGNVTLTSPGNLTFNRTDAAYTYGGIISGTGSLTQAGAGTTTLTGNNSFTGATTVSAGKLSVVATYTANWKSSVAIAAGATFNWNVTGLRGIADTAGNFNITGAGLFTVSGTGRQLFSNGNPVVHIYMDAGGQIDVQNTSILELGYGDNGMGGNLASLNVNTGASYRNSDASAVVDALTGGGVVGNAYSANPFVLTVGASNTLNNAAYGVSSNTATFSGVIKDEEGYNGQTAGAGTVTAITKTGTGTQIFSGASTYTGVTTLTGGILSVATIGNGGVSGNLGKATNAATKLVFNGGTLQYTGATASTNRSFTINAGKTATFDITTNNLTISGASTNTNGALTKTGAGTLTLSGTNLHTGATTVSAGTLQFAKMASLYNNTPASWTAANINVKSGATLALNVDSAGTAGFTSANLNTLLTNISVAGSATAGLQAGATVGFDTSTATAGTFTQGNLIANSTGANGGAIGVTKLGTGTLVFDKANTYTGATTLTAGTLSVATIGNGGVSGNLGAATNADANLVFNGGTLQYTGAMASTDRNFTINTGKTATFDITTNNLTISGAPTATNGALTKTGAGTMTLSGTNSYTGATTVSVGTLTLASTASLANTAITVASGATLSVAGNVTSAGTLTLNSGSLFTMSGDNALGTLTLGGAGTGLTLNGATVPILTFDIGNAATGTDRIIVNNNASVLTGGTINIAQLTGLTSLTAGNYNLITSAGGFSGSGGNGFTLNSSTITVAGTLYDLTLANSTGSNEILTVSLSAGLSSYWAGAADVNWNTAANWRTTVAGGVPTGVSPSSITNVFFVTTTPGAMNLTTSLGADTTIISLTFTNDATSPVSIGGNTLTLNAGAGNGISVAANSAAHTISSNVALGASQTWTVNNAPANALTVSGVVSDGGSGYALTKVGTGTLILSGANTYTGVTTITAGTLSVATIGNGGVSGNLGAATNAATNMVFDGGTLQYTGATASTDRNFTINTGKTAIFDITTNNLTISGASTGTNGALTKIGAGTLTLTGANTYTGVTTVSAGVLSSNNLNVWKSSVAIAAGATFNWNSASNQQVADTAGDYTVTGAGLLTLSGGALLKFSIDTPIVQFNLSAGGQMDVQGSGTVVEFGYNKNSMGGNLGSLNVEAGTSYRNSDASAVVDALTGGGVVGNAYNATFTLTVGASNTVNNATYGVSSNTATFSGVIKNVDGYNGQTTGVPNPSSGLSSLIKVGTGTQILSGANTYTGVTTITAGTLSVDTIGNGGVSGNLGQATNAAANLVFDGGTLQYTGSTASTDRNFTINTGKTATFDITTNNLTVSGASTATNGALTKIGAGTLTLSSANTYTGVTTVSGGVLQIGNGGTLGTLGTGNVTLTSPGNLTFNRTDAAYTYAGAISGTGSLTQAGTGTTTLTGANSYTGATTVSAGTLISNNLNVWKSSVTIAAGATFNWNVTAADQKVANTAGNYTVSGTGLLTLSGGKKMDFGNNAPIVQFNMSGGGQIDVQGTNTHVEFGYTHNSMGGNLGSLNVATGAKYYNSDASAVVDALTGGGYIANAYNGQFTLTVGVSNTTNNAAYGVAGNTATFSGIIAGPESINGTTTGLAHVVKTGTGTQIFSGASTYTGSTTISAGTLTLGATGDATNTPLGTTATGTTVSATGAALDLGGFTLGTAEALSLAGTGVSATGALTNSGAAASYSGIVTLGAGGASIGGTGDITLTAGLFANANALTKVGANVLALNAASTRTGATTISAGTIDQGASNALGTGSAALSIAPTTGTGLYNMTGAFSQTVGLVTLGGAGGTTANITTGTGTLTMGGDLTYDATNNPNGATISGLLDLGTTQKTFTIGNSTAAADDVTVTAAVSNGGGGSILKTGLGTLRLDGAQGYDTLTVNDGTTNVNGSLTTLTAAVTVTDSGNGTKLRFGSVSQTLSSLTIGAGATVTFTRGTASGSFSGGGFGGKVARFGGTAVVPEPGTLGLLLVGALGMLNRRRRQA